MRTYVDTCVAAAEAAGWSGTALQGLILNPRSETPEGFRALLKEANDIRGLVKIIGPQMRALGFHPDDAADYFVSQGYTLDQVRSDTVREMVEYDDATVVNTTPPAAKAVLADPYKARAAMIEAYKAK